MTCKALTSVIYSKCFYVCCLCVLKLWIGLTDENIEVDSDIVFG